MKMEAPTGPGENGNEYCMLSHEFFVCEKPVVGKRPDWAWGGVGGRTTKSQGHKTLGVNCVVRRSTDRTGLGKGGIVL